MALRGNVLLKNTTVDVQKQGTTSRLLMCKKDTVVYFYISFYNK